MRRVHVRRGSVMIYMIIAFTAFCAFVSLAVDLGHVQLAKTELRSAADAAALAAAKDLINGTSSAQSTAISVAAANKADGTAVALTSADIEFGFWNVNTNTFTVVTGSQLSTANAIRVTARRTAARGNPIGLHFAKLIGQNTCDVSATSTAYSSNTSGGYIGISLSRMYNTAHFDGYYSSANTPYSSSAAVPGTLLSFKDMWLYDYSSVYGEAHWDVSGVFNHDSTATVSGAMNAEPLNHNFPAVTVSNEATVNDNSNLSLYYTNDQLVIPDNKGTVTYTGGTYYFTKFDPGKGNTVVFTNPTVIYLKCGGQITCSIRPSNYLPRNLAIKVLPTYNWTIDSGGNVYGTIYNPTGDVHHHNGGISHGSVISDLLCFRQTSEGHQDMSLGKYATAATISLVK